MGRSRKVGHPGAAAITAVGFAVVALLGAIVPIAPPAGAIYNGKNVTFKQYKWMVSIRYASAPKKHICGGTLIGARMVLTAAHCVALSDPKKFVVVVGADADKWATAPRVQVIGFRKGAYDPKRYGSNKDDIAVLRLKTAQTGPKIKLATAEPKAGDKVTTAGWGCTQKPLACSGHSSARLKVADQTVLADAQCDTTAFSAPPAYGPTTICAKGTATVNGGDSGGPLLRGNPTSGFVVTGVTSLRTDNPNKLYASFTSVARERLWINNAIAVLAKAG